MISLHARLGSSSYKKEKTFWGESKGQVSYKRREMEESSLRWGKEDISSGAPKEG
jgi:hypothetical protein